MAGALSSVFSCCMRGGGEEEEEQNAGPSERTRLLSPQPTPPPVIDEQPPPQAPSEHEEDDELDAIYADMIGSMVRVKQANPFLTATVPSQPNSRNPSPQSSRADRSRSRGRTMNALQIRRIRPGRGERKPRPDLPGDHQNGDEQAENGAGPGAGETASMTGSEASQDLMRTEGGSEPRKKDPGEGD